MPDQARHCPFLNRSDDRCSSHFSLGRLSEAYDQCFDAYGGCAVYHELLLERRERRGELSAWLTGAASNANANVGDRPNGSPHVQTKLVQLTVAASGTRPAQDGRFAS